MRSIRSSRSAPPGQAGNDGHRRGVYAGAIEQFEQLLTAAGSVGAASRALPLFYALSQASRALVAAFGEDPDIGQHGLAEDRAHQPYDLLHRRIKRRPAADGSDAFGSLARATGSPDFDGTLELGAVWVALAETHRIPEESWLPEWRTPLSLLDETTYRGEKGRVQVQAISMGGNPHLDEVGTLRGRYPSLPQNTEVGLKSKDHPAELGDGNWIVVLTWDDSTALSKVATGTALNDSGAYLFPNSPEEVSMPSELMLWWALLFGLSIFTRYHPATWKAALDLDRSSLAVPLEAVLEKATEAVPAVVHQALWH